MFAYTLRYFLSVFVLKVMRFLSYLIRFKMGFEVNCDKREQSASLED